MNIRFAGFGKTKGCKLLGLCFGLLLAFAACQPNGLYAQDVSEAFSGFSTSGDEPIQIEADELEVRDRDKTAIFSGNVKLVQGPTILQASSIQVYYSASTDSNSQEITKVEAQGPIHVENGEQTARGNFATFVMSSQVLTLAGDVVLSKGRNEIRGQQLVVNLRTGESRMEAGGGASSSGRVQGVFVPGAQ